MTSRTGINRFAFVLAASVAPQDMPLPVLAKELCNAIEQCEGEGVNPGEDPAVLILGAFVAFHTHADVNTMDGYNKMLSMCETRLTAPLAIH